MMGLEGGDYCGILVDLGLCGDCGNWVRYQDVDRISRFVWGLCKLGKMSGCGQNR